MYLAINMDHTLGQAMSKQLWFLLKNYVFNMYRFFFSLSLKTHFWKTKVLQILSTWHVLSNLISTDRL